MKFEVNISRKQVYATILILSLIVNAALIVEISATATSLPPWTLNAPPSSAFDVKVGSYSNGTYYYETSDWQTWVNNADPSTTIQNAVNLASGQTVVVDSGAYTLTSGVVATTSNITLKFLAGATITINANVSFLTLTTDNWVIDGLVLHGGRNSGVTFGHGIISDGADNLKIVNSEFYDVANRSIYNANSVNVQLENNLINNSRCGGVFWNNVNDSSCIATTINYCGSAGDSTAKDSALEIYACYRNMIETVHTYRSYYEGMGGFLSNDNTFNCNIATEAGYGHGTAGDQGFNFQDMDKNTIIGNKAINTLGSAADGEGFMLSQSSDQNNLIGNTASGGARNGFYLTGTPSNNAFYSNYAYDNAHYGVRQDSGTATEIINMHYYNNGYGTITILGGTQFKSENSFSGANTTATTAVISHGLASTATFVWCSFNSTAITGYTWTSSATQVTITATGTLPASWTCYVKAEYQP